jgi:hypothetical protein
MFQPTLFPSDILDHPRPYLPPPRELRPRRSAPAHRRGRTNWLSRSTGRTLDFQDQLVAALQGASLGFTVRELGEALGTSRQHALYHVKKAVAAGRIVMLLEPCEANAGLQFRCWNQTQLARRYARTLPMAERVDIFMRVHSAA